MAGHLSLGLSLRQSCKHEYSDKCPNTFVLLLAHAFLKVSVDFGTCACAGKKQNFFICKRYIFLLVYKIIY